ncbi:MAG: hypothetical protein IT287_04480 [Bdellovibrionaceae bacterium]|nr:hypothetical protein [Pseudobdellovibrionaceae bacterium]
MKITCTSCLKLEAPFNCGLCQDALCKKCAQFLDPNYFSFYESVPEVLKHSEYCRTCYDSKVSSHVDAYEKMLHKARNMFVFFRGQGKDVRSLQIKRPDTTLEVTDCEDYDETILRLAFRAAEKDYNVLVDVETHSEKIHNGSYHTLKWRGKATPTNAEEGRLNRQVDPRFLK